MQLLRSNYWVFSVLLVLSGCASMSNNNDTIVTSGQKQGVITYDNLPQVAQLNYQMGIGYISNGRMDVAESKLMNVINAAPNFPDAYNAMGVLQEERGKIDNAITFYAKALSIHPNYEEAANNYARVQCVAGLDKITQIAKNAPNSSVRAGLYAGAANCALGRKDMVNAEQLADQAIQSNPTYPYSYFVKARVAALSNNSASAFTALDEYHNLAGYKPSSVQFGLQLAQQIGDQTRINQYQTVQQTQFK